MPNIIVESNGTIRFIYDDRLKDLLHNGSAVIQRVSHVEPTTAGDWTADLTPVQGPVLGPFSFRQQALDAEINWLNNNVL